MADQSDFILVVYRNYGLTPQDEVFNEGVRIDSEHSEYTVQFDSGVNGKNFALEVRWSPHLDAEDTALLEPPVEIDFNYEIEEVDDVPAYQYDIKSPPQQQGVAKRKPIPPEEDVEYRFDLPRAVKPPQSPKRKVIPPEEDVEYKYDLPFMRK